MHDSAVMCVTQLLCACTDTAHLKKKTSIATVKSVRFIFFGEFCCDGW